MKIICPHCGKKQKISLKLLFDLRCRACNERMDRSRSKLYTFIKVLIRFAAIFTMCRILDFSEPISKHLGINLWIIFATLFILGVIFICMVELISIRISCLINKKKTN